MGLADSAERVTVVDDSDWVVKLNCGPCECGRKYPGSARSGGHCPTCHLSFASQTGFEKHLRRGRYDRTEPWCYSVEELTAKGWTVDEHFVVRMPAPTFWNNATTPTDGLPVPPAG